MNTKKDFPFSIGCDPEFNIMIKDRRVNASKLMPALFSKNFKEEKNEHNGNSVMGYLIEDAGALGWDGCSSTGEIRPAPSKSPEVLVSNIGKLLKAFSDKTKMFTLSTLSSAAPVGGHLHFQIDKNLAEKNDPGITRKLENIHRKFISFYLPVLLGEDQMDFRTRMAMGKNNGSNYGLIDDWRAEFRDTAHKVATYEFRVPSATWLTTPEIAKATIAYLATVWNEIQNNPKNLAKSKGIMFQSKKQSLAFQDLALSRYLMVMKLILVKIRRHIKTFEYYPHYQKEIDFILSPQRVLVAKRKAQFDILKGWKLDVAGQPTKKQLLSDKYLAKESVKSNIDALSEIVNISANNDVNIPHFVSAIKTRIIALNWELKFTYFIYGLRPNIPGYIVANKNLQFLAGSEMVKTRLDWDSVRNSVKKMDDRFTINIQDNGTQLPSTAEENKKYIMIGVPYSERMQLKTKDFIKLIYDIENENLKPHTLNIDSLFDDTDIPDDAPREEVNKIGKIFIAYNEDKFKDIVSSGIDSETRRHQQTAQAVRTEIEQEERQAVS